MMRQKFWVSLAACVFGLLLLLSVVRTQWAESESLPASRRVENPSRLSVLSVQDSQVREPSDRLPKSAPNSIPKRVVKPSVSVNPASGPVFRPVDIHRLAEVACLERPDRPHPLTPEELAPLKITLPLVRFRSTALSQGAMNGQESVLLAHPSNFGWRFLRDVTGQVVQNAPIVVLHETVGSYESAIELFKSPHEDDDDQVSYHALIRDDGRIVYTVPPDRRAYGAGNSVFVNSDRQEESVKTNPNYPSSVNNFAYHISLVSPEDGYTSDADSHSGYTKAQYESLAWLVAKTRIPEDRITTHRLVDRSGSRQDPRSFNVPYFLQQLRTQPASQEIPIGCSNPLR